MTPEKAKRAGEVAHELQAIESFEKECASLVSSPWNVPGFVCIGIQFSRYSHFHDVILENDIKDAIEAYKGRLTEELKAL